jgi:hypothetical protein
MQRTCSRCRHWRRTHAQSDVGRCRRYPPEPSDVEAVEGSPPRLVVLHDWPLTIASDCCGEFINHVLPLAYPSPVAVN